MVVSSLGGRSYKPGPIVERLCCRHSRTLCFVQSPEPQRVSQARTVTQIYSNFNTSKCQCLHSPAAPVDDTSRTNLIRTACWRYNVVENVHSPLCRTWATRRPKRTPRPGTSVHKLLYFWTPTHSHRYRYPITCLVTSKKRPSYCITAADNTSRYPPGLSVWKVPKVGC